LSHYNINAGVPKTLISYLIQWASDTIFVQEKDVQAVLHDILNTPVSPELLPPSESGEILQKSEDSIGPNELTDFFGYYFVRFGMRPLKVARLAYAAFGEKYSLAVIKKWLAVFLRRFFANQFKRSCTPDGPKVGLLALSPRGDWRMPSDANATAYLADMDLIPNEEDM
jgi:NAD+ synthase (glutamine-hydrolysing)